MSSSPSLLVFAGSAREQSYNKKLARVAAAAASEVGAHARFIDLRDYPLPLFDEDLEAREGEPTAATALKKLMKESHGFIIASPEHNSTYSALLKNTIDWASRRRDGEARLAAFAGKIALLTSASPGNLGGLRGLFNLRALLSNLGVIVLPDMLTIPTAHQAFDETGQLKDADQRQNLKKLVANFVLMLQKLNA